MLENLPIKIRGHVHIKDDLDNVLVDKHNAVHPQNLARAFARALSNESNFRIEAMAFGNGGTFINATQQIQYNTPHDGQAPDTKTWDSRPYKETYREIVQEGNPTLNPLLGTNPAGGAVASSDPTSIPHVSGPGVRSSELGLTSEVVVTCVLNPNEPRGQYTSDIVNPLEDPDSSFMFDEIALFTSGAPETAKFGYQNLDVGDRNANSDTGLTANTIYKFTMTIDGGSPMIIRMQTPSGGGSGSGGEILYGDLVKALRTGQASWGIQVDGVPVTGVNAWNNDANVDITNDGSFDAAVPAAETFGYLRFRSTSTGSGSSIAISPGPDHNLLSALNPPTGAQIVTAVPGKNQGVQNNPTSSTTERERMLTHVIFSPVLKSKNRTLTITYTLTISVARSY